jgi:hypothetical protein
VTGRIENHGRVGLFGRKFALDRMDLIASLSANCIAKRGRAATIANGGEKLT